MKYITSNLIIDTLILKSRCFEDYRNVYECDKELQKE